MSQRKYNAELIANKISNLISSNYVSYIDLSQLTPNFIAAQMADAMFPFTVEGQTIEEFETLKVEQIKYLEGNDYIIRRLEVYKMLLIKINCDLQNLSVAINSVNDFMVNLYSASLYVKNPFSEILRQNLDNVSMNVFLAIDLTLEFNIEVHTVLINAPTAIESLIRNIQ